MKVLLAHPGTQYSYQLARQLYRQGLLSEFWTGIALAEGSLPEKALRALPGLHSRLSNRIIESLPSDKVRLLPRPELHALWKLRASRTQQEIFLERNRIFQESIPDAALKRADSVIGFDTSSWLIAECALQLRKPFFLDQSISHPLANQRILREMAKAFPDWVETIETRLHELLAHEEREYKLAERIIVASSFTKRTLVENGISAEKIIINPYGVDLEKFHPALRRRSPRRFLFLGTISARKGVPLLIEAWKNIQPTKDELWLVGPVSEKERSLIPNIAGLKVIGKLPHRELPELLRACDVLVFPSYIEGFGLVILEAMASGLPVITTTNTAGPDILQDRREGRLIPPGDLDALCEAMLSISPEMGVHARRRAEAFSWDAYGERWQRILKGLPLPPSMASIVEQEEPQPLAV